MFGITDTAGTHNLHGLPAWVAAIAGVLATSSLTATSVLPFGLEYREIFPRHVGDGDTSSYQAAMIGVTVALGIGWGSVVGIIARVIRGPSIADTFTDAVYWHVPDDFKKTLRQSGAVSAPLRGGGC